MKMMIIILMLMIFKLNFSFAGGAVGNGGDAVYCRPSSSNSFSGFYALDYLVQYQKNVLAIDVKSLQQSLERIEIGLQSKIPELARDFADFKSQLFNERDASKKYLWEPATFGLINLKDESLVATLPENCRDEEKISITQAVIRMSEVFSGRPLNKFLFRYDPNVIHDLLQSSPLQLSFLLVHEWLWNFSDIVDRNRRLNYWLHSNSLDEWSREEWIKNLNGIGFRIPGVKLDPFEEGHCPQDQSAVEELFRMVDMYREKSYLYGYGSASQRGKYCSTQDGHCSVGFFDGPPRTSLIADKLEFKSHLFVVLKYDSIEVRSRENGDRAVTHFSCKLNRELRRIEGCSKLISASGYEHRPSLQFIPTVGRNCMSFRAHVLIPKDITQRNVNLMEYILNFSALGSSFDILMNTN